MLSTPANICAGKYLPNTSRRDHKERKSSPKEISTGTSEMRVWSLLCFFLTVTTSTANNIALFWNLYDAVISGGRILHDVADGVGAVSKAIRAIDSFLDSTAEAQVRITATLQ